MVKFFAILLICANAFAMKAGVARTDITPPPGIAQWGYGNRTGPATGTRDPLWARVLLLDDDTTRVALVTLDLGRTFGETQMDWVRAQLRPERIQVIFSASHTHSGPWIEDEYPGGAVPAWEKAALQKIVEAIRRAYGARVQARLGAGWSIAYIGHDRRYTRQDGSVFMLWRNSTAVPTYPVDPTVAILRVDDTSGKPMAILVNYACHPVVFGPDNLRYSADWPGAMREAIEKEMGGTAFFLQGAPGDINPFVDKTPLIEDAEHEMQRTGEKMAAAVVQAARTIVTAPLAAEDHLGLRVDTLRFRLRWDPAAMRSWIERAMPESQRGRYAAYMKPEMDLPVTTFTIGKQIAMVGMPGEPFVGFQMDLRTRAPLPYTFFAGYTNGYYAYFPGVREAVSGGYGADGVTTRVEVGAGERMLDRAIVNIYRLLGKLGDRPERPQ